MTIAAAIVLLAKLVYAGLLLLGVAHLVVNGERLMALAFGLAVGLILMI